MDRPPRRPLEISTGLLEPKHFAAIGTALPLYLVLLALTPAGSSWVRGKRPTAIRDLGRRIGAAPRSVRRWLSQLEEAGYILVHRRREGRDGGLEAAPRIGVRRKKWWRGSMMVTEDDPTGQIRPVEDGNGADSPRSTGQIRPVNGADLAAQRGENAPFTPLTLIDTQKPQRSTPEKNKTENRSNRSRLEAARAADADLDKRKIELWARYTDDEDRTVLREAFARVNRARRSGRASLHVLVRLLEDLDKFEIEDVVDGAERFLAREIVAGQPENYWLGCCRGAKREREAHERAFEEA